MARKTSEQRGDGDRAVLIFIPGTYIIAMGAVVIYIMFHLLSRLPTVSGALQTGKPAFNCKGGSIYFAAHPADVLLYQNPDIFHDLYVFKCTTVVLFTSGDRGIRGNYSRSLERGFADALAWMTHQEQDITSWNSDDVQLNGQVVLVRSLKEMPNVHVVYLRLPHSAPDGTPYPDNDGQSLKKLYDGRIREVDSMDGSATYSLDELKELISTILQKRQPNDIRILDQKTPIPGDGEEGRDHADHSVSARLVVEAMERDKLKGNVHGYACGSMHKLDTTLDEKDARIKTGAYFEYVPYDNFTCQSYQDCEFEAEEGDEKSLPDNDDTRYVVKWMEREYYIQ